jgi:uncharacterized membrane protein
MMTTFGFFLVRGHLFFINASWLFFPKDDYEILVVDGESFLLLLIFIFDIYGIENLRLKTLHFIDIISTSLNVGWHKALWL